MVLIFFFLLFIVFFFQAEDGIRDPVRSRGLGDVYKRQGGAYDISLAKEHRLTIAATFTSNSFTNDQYTGGLEYGFKNIFMLRGGFTYEEDLFDDNLRTTIYSGPSAGMSVSYTHLTLPTSDLV